MVDLVFSYIVKAILIISSCFLYVFFVSKILPALFLKPKRKKEEPRDRGIKRYVFDQGRGIVYTPEPHTQKYITQYILSENNGEKFLKCKFDNRVVTANYAVTVFNSSNKVIDVIKVYDTPDRKKTARAVPLPLSASYVNISVEKINHQKTTTEKKESVSFSSYIFYIILSTAATVAISLIINAAAIHIADLCLNYTERLGDPGILSPIITALILSAFYTAINIKRCLKSNRTP